MPTSAVPQTAVGWAYSTDHGNAHLHFYRRGRSLCWKWTVSIARPSITKWAGKIERYRNLGWVCERCYSESRRAVAA